MRDIDPQRRIRPRSPEPFPLARLESGDQLPAVPPELVERAKELIREASADNSRMARETDWRRYREWCQGIGVAPMPARPETIVLYLTWLATECPDGRRREAGLTVNAVKRAKSTISRFHREAGMPSPCDVQIVRDCVRGFARREAGETWRAKPIMPVHLRAMIYYLRGRWPKNSLRWARGAALLLTGFAGALRRSELVALRRQDVEVKRSGLRIFVRRSKTDPEGKGVWVTFPRHPVLTGQGLCPSYALARWIQWSGIKDGYLFRKISDGDATKDRVSGKLVDRLVEDCIAGVDLDPGEYGAHSLRAGYVTWAKDVMGYDVVTIKKHTRHRSTAVLEGYIRKPDVLSEKWMSVRLAPNP